MISGLTTAEAARRREEAGANTFGVRRPKRARAILGAQFSNPLIVVLAVAALVATLLGETLEALVILGIVAVNGLLGFAQEFRAERALQALQRLIVHRVRVERDGAEQEVPSTDLVPGDLVVLGIGDVICADLELVEADGLAADESAWSGESLPRDKLAPPEGAGDTARLFAGSTVAGGSGRAVVLATGQRTRLGGTAGLFERPEPESDFQRGLRRFGQFLVRVVLLLTAFVAAANALLGKGVLDSLLFALALAVGITPEALPVVVTVTLSNGALRLSRAHVLVRRLRSIEDLGNTDVLCCDKTGTLTEGSLVLRAAVDVAGGGSEAVALDALLCTTGESGLDHALRTALLAAPLATRLGAARQLDLNEFDFERRRMSTLVELDGRRRLLVKGAPESVLAVCRTVAGEPLDAARSAAVAARIANWEREGLRVLAVASRPFAADRATADDERELELSGFLLFADPPKATAAAALATFRQLGVRLVLMTGDSPTVATRIASEVGLTIAPERVISGEELAALPASRWPELVARHDLFARVNPEQKRLLVACLRDQGHVTGFLGDGINDAPALREADVGISVDTGAEIAKDAADILLLEKDLGAVANGIREGRKTFGNIIKYIQNTVSANFGNMTTVAVSSLFLRFIPLLPSQILLTNLLSDLPLVMISTDRVDDDLLARPRRWNLSRITHFMVWFGILSALFDLLLITLLMRTFDTPVGQFRTAWFVESTCSEILVTFAIRSRRSFLSSRPSGWLLGVSAAAATVTALLPLTPFGQRIFGFVPLGAPLGAAVAGILVAYFFAAEGLKRCYYRYIDPLGPNHAARPAAVTP
jgi:Mg2+-importing ATPase